jgi:hypothetical protein
MNTITRLLVIGTAVLVAACANNKAQMSASDPFRINMQMGYGPNTPTTPAPIPPATSWVDVTNWQTFLMLQPGQTYLTVPAYPNDNFDQMTKQATIWFQQATINGHGPVMPPPPPGVVNLATYNKAVALGMPPYPHQ